MLAVYTAPDSQFADLMTVFVCVCATVTVAEYFS